jgi:hypothetical protein
VTVDDFAAPEGVEVDPILDYGVKAGMLVMTYNVPVFNLLGHCQEGLFNVGGILG